MSKIQIDKIAPNKSDHVTLEGDLVVTGKINGNLPNVSFLPTVPMVYATAWQRAASNFEFAFNDLKWWNTGLPFNGGPTVGNRPYSNDINPRTGNAYMQDYRNSIRPFVAGTRIAWLDDDTSKFYDWKYTYVNPFTLQPQIWEPKGMVMQNADPTNFYQFWNSTTFYSVGTYVKYNGFMWICNIANSNKIPNTISPNTDYWHNTGILLNTGYNGTVPFLLQTKFPFNASGGINGQAKFYLNGSLDGGIRYWGYDLSNEFSYFVQGKMPVITLNVFMNSSNSNRYPSPFNVQHQMDMLDYINTGMGLNPNTLPKVDMINLGSNIDVGDLNCTCGPTLNAPPYGSGYNYGSAMTEYVNQIRNNSEVTTANAKIIMSTVVRSIYSSSLAPNTRWVFDSINPLDTLQGFIHGFYNSFNNPNGVDFDIISLRTNYQNAEGISYYQNSRNNLSSVSWSYLMGGSQYINMRDTIIGCKQALSLYNKQNRIKYWYKYRSRAVSNPNALYTLNQANYSWATQTGVFMAMVLAVTDPDFTGFQYGSLVDYGDCSVNVLYVETNTFGSNTTNVFDLTSVGWMFKYFLNYFKPAYGAISYTRILKSGSLGQYGFNLSDYCMGVYINSSGINGSPQHRIILCNYSAQDNQSIDIDSSQLIDPNWTNVKFMKVYTPLSIYEPINFYSAGNYITVQEILPYAPTVAQKLSTPLLPSEYLIITAD